MGRQQIQEGLGKHLESVERWQTAEIERGEADEAFSDAEHVARLSEHEKKLRDEDSVEAYRNLSQAAQEFKLGILKDDTLDDLTKVVLFDALNNKDVVDEGTLVGYANGQLEKVARVENLLRTDNLVAVQSDWQFYLGRPDADMPIQVYPPALSERVKDSIIGDGGVYFHLDGYAFSHRQGIYDNITDRLRTQKEMGFTLVGVETSNTRPHSFEVVKVGAVESYLQDKPDFVKYDVRRALTELGVLELADKIELSESFVNESSEYLAGVITAAITDGAVGSSYSTRDADASVARKFELKSLTSQSKWLHIDSAASVISGLGVSTAEVVEVVERNLIPTEEDSVTVTAKKISALSVLNSLSSTIDEEVNKAL